ncbi:MAG: M48 family metallopeptidase, partial [Pseudomonadota bacterium]
IAMKLHRVRPVGAPPPIVRVIDDKTPNAFTTGGGYVYIHTGLIRIMRNEAELAMVLGHEMAHGDLNHIRERGRAAATTSVLGQLAGVVIGQTIGGGLGGAAANTAAGLALQAGFTSFSRDQERGADEIGLRYIARSGYDDRAGAQAFGSLQRASGGRRGGPSWLSTHPLSGERLATLSALSERTQGGSFIGRDVYQRRALSRLR